MQLTRVLLNRGVPGLQPLLHLSGGEAFGELQVAVDGQVIPHGIALHQGAHAVDIDRLAVRSCSGGRKPDLATPGSTQVGLHGHPPQHVGGIGIAQVQKRF